MNYQHEINNNFKTFKALHIHFIPISGPQQPINVPNWLPCKWNFKKNLQSPKNVETNH